MELKSQKQLGGRKRQRLRKRLLAEQVKRDLNDALNSIYGIGNRGSKTEDPSLCQQSALQYLMQLGEELRRWGLRRPEEISVINDADAYLQEISVKLLWLDSGKNFASIRPNGKKCGHDWVVTAWGEGHVLKL